MTTRPIYRKGMLILGSPVDPSGNFVRPPQRRDREDIALRRQFPQFADTFKLLGPTPEEARLAAIEASHREVEARIAALREKAEAFLKATGRK